MSKDVQSAVLELLQKLKGIDSLKRLFWSELNYDRLNQACSTSGWPAHILAFLSENPVLLASHSDFYVIYNRFKSDLFTGQERQIVNQLIKNYPYALFVFSDSRQESWHFVNVKNHPEIQKRKVFRRITIQPNEHHRTAAERLALIDIESFPNTTPSSISPLAIQERHDEAFNVEKIGRNSFWVTGTISGCLWTLFGVLIKASLISWEKEVMRIFTDLPNFSLAGFFSSISFKKKVG